jgi:hypothetical protein
MPSSRAIEFGSMVTVGPAVWFHCRSGVLATCEIGVSASSSQMSPPA